jgi:enoyl-CoA hydratase
MGEQILAEREGRVALLTLNRPQALNALSLPLLEELDAALAACDADREVGCVVLLGSDRAFAAGADVREMAPLTFPDTLLDDIFAVGDRLAGRRKPKIAAVAGVALGGGCELAMLCDFIIAAETARFGQPEVRLGILPGLGGTQRLTRLVGRAKAMDMCLTGRTLDAAEAERAGLVARVVPAEKLRDEALAAAQAIANLPLPAVLLAKEAVNRAEEIGLSEGVRFERRVFQSLFATADQKEGMDAFMAKRPPAFGHR